MYKRFLKRILDIMGALFLVILLSPLFILIGLILWVYNKGDVFFIQLRPGKNEKPFRLYKFQTMKVVSNKEGLETEQITAPGNILRKSSLDEIPQLINVLKGEMSFVGPRPLLMEYLPLYSEVQRKRHSVLPGITGWAQINGRNSISWDEKFALDLYYIAHVSFWLDLKILLLTGIKVFSGRNIYNDKNEPMEKFAGNQAK